MRKALVIALLVVPPLAGAGWLALLLYRHPPFQYPVDGKVPSEWVRLLRDPDPAVRRQAAEALDRSVKVGPPAYAADDLIRCLHDENPGVRWRCACVLGTIGGR